MPAELAQCRDCEARGSKQETAQLGSLCPPICPPPQSAPSGGRGLPLMNTWYQTPNSGLINPGQMKGIYSWVLSSGGTQ